MISVSKKTIKKALAPVTAVAISAVASVKTFALDVSRGISAAGGGGQSTRTVEQTIATVVSIAMWAVGIISVIILIFAGIMYATAAGDEAKVGKAKKAIIGSIIGLAVAILAGAIARFVQGAL